MCKVGACSCGASATSSKLGETKNLLHTMGITRNYIFLKYTYLAIFCDLFGMVIRDPFNGES